MLNTKVTQRNKKPISNWEGLEAIKELPRDTAQVARDEAINMARDVGRQLFNFEKSAQKLSGELNVGESLNLANTNAWPQHEPESPEIDRYVQPGIDYYREFRPIKERRLVQEDTRSNQMRIEQIIVELRKLILSSQELTVEFKEVTMEETPQEPGTYHLNFFEWVFSVIRKARERIEESQTWLSMFKSKKKQHGYWNMFKKHGTTFGLSGERVVATQTG